MAGLTSFFTCSYIILVNPLILQDAGVPLSAGIVATLAASIAGCLLMALWANAPVILIPGMGINAFFSYTMVQSMGLTPQQGLAVIILSGIIFFLVAISPAGMRLMAAVPDSLKHGITAGIGLLLTFIGLQKGGIIEADSTTVLTLGNLASPVTLSTVIGLIVTFMLVARNTRGGLLIGLLTTAILILIIEPGIAAGTETLDLQAYRQLFNSAEFSMLRLPFWMAAFSITMIVLFENMGLLSGMLSDPAKFPRAFKSAAVSTMLSGLFGTSPTVAAAESASGISEGAKTGIPALVTAVLFALCAFVLPYVQYIPGNAVAPVLIVVGALMMKSIAAIKFEDFTEWLPAFLIIVCIPLTLSIADGLSFGFIAYPLVKIAVGKWREVSPFLYVTAFLFLLNLIALFLYNH